MTYRDDLAAAEKKARLELEREEERSRLAAVTKAAPSRFTWSWSYVSVPLGTLAFLALLFTLPGVCGPPLPSGQGDLTFHQADASASSRVILSACSAGGHHNFIGADLSTGGEPGRVVRVLEDPVRGTLVLLTLPGAEASPQEVALQACKRRDVSIHEQGSSNNDVHLVDVTFDLDCVIPGDAGVSFSAKGSFENCD